MLRNYFREKSLMHIVHKLALDSFDDVQFDNCGILRMSSQVSLNYNEHKPHYDISEAEMIIKGKLAFIDEYMISMEMFDVVKSIGMLEPVVQGDVAIVKFFIKIHPSYLIRHTRIIKNSFIYSLIILFIFSTASYIIGVLDIKTIISCVMLYLVLYTSAIVFVTYLVHKPISRRRLKLLKRLDYVEKEKEIESKDAMVQGQGDMG